MDKTEKELQNQEITKAIGESIKANLPDVVDAVVDAKFKAFEEKVSGDMSEIKELAKTAMLASKFSEKAQEMAHKTAVVAIMKDVVKNNITSESAFKDVVNAHVKTMTEGTATAGDELVFDQFEQSVLQVINTFEVVNLVRTINIVKGDVLKIPKVTNGITTAYVAEAAAASASDLTTAFVTINVYKAMTLTNFTEELLDDTMTVPDLYDLIVNNVGESQGAFLEKEILSGTGSSAIEGLLVNASVVSVQLAATKRAVDLTDANMISVYTGSVVKYKRNAGALRWIMSQYVKGILQSLRTTDGYPLYPELRLPEPTLMGAKVVLTDSAGICQSAAADAVAKPYAIFGDFSNYILVRRKGITMERGYYASNWVSNIQSLKSTSRFGGKCAFGEAFTKVIGGAT